MKPLARSLAALGTVASLAVLPACSSSSGGTSAGHKPRIVTAFYPFQYLAQQVAGDHAEVTSLTAPGAEPHDLELTARQVASLSEADVVIYEKGFQGAVDKAVEQSSPKKVVDVATLVPALPATGTDEDGHAATGNDPHVWLAPKNMQAMAKGVAEAVKATTPSAAADVDANLARLDAQLAELDREFAADLTGCQRTDFITSHAAFGHLAKAYGLTQVGISGLSPDAEPSPARVVEVQKLARAKGVTTIFYETLVSPAQAKTIAGDLGLRTDVLDPIEGITKDSRGSDYIAVQKANLAALRTANGCR